MLWYKAWRESRLRFIVSVVSLATACLLIVAYQKAELAQAQELVTYAEYVWVWTYRGGVKNLFILLVPLLGLGGLLRERAYGTVAFTLALPVTRLQLVRTRAAMGLVQMGVLALLPAVLIPTISPLVHQSYPFSQAIRFSLLWIDCGTVLIAMAFLLSSLLGGEFSAMVATYVGLFSYIYVSRSPVLRSYAFIDLWRIMGGYEMPYFRSDSYQLTGSLPWGMLSGIALLSLTTLVLAVYIVQRRDFS
jgi:ABC-2 type transport system permease protein